MMSLFRTASTTAASFLALAAASVLPMRPCSSPANATNTSVLSNSYWLITRASSITAAVPVPAWRRQVRILLPVGLHRPFAHRGGRFIRGRAGGRAQVERIVVPRHPDLRFGHGLTRQHGHHVPEVHILEDALSLLLHLPLVEAHLEARVVTLELVEDPLPGRPGAAGRIVLRRHGVARAKTGQLFDDGLNARLRDRVHNLADLRIHALLVRVGDVCGKTERSGDG